MKTSKENIVDCAKSVADSLQVNMHELIQVLSSVLAKPIAFHRIFVDLTGSVTAGLMLSQIWFLKDTPTVKDRGGDWFFHTVSEWSTEIGLSRYEQESARRTLRQLGFISERRKGVPPLISTTIHAQNIVKAILEHCNSRQDTNLLENHILSCGKTTYCHVEKPHDSTETCTETCTESINTCTSASPTPSPEVPHQNTNGITSTIFAEWNALPKVVHHKALTDSIRRAINARLKQGYSVGDFQQAFTCYAEILADPDRYWLTYKWPLKDFVASNRFDAFLSGEAKENYVQTAIKEKDQRAQRTAQVLAELHRWAVEEDAKDEQNGI